MSSPRILISTLTTVSALVGITAWSSFAGQQTTRQSTEKEVTTFEVDPVHSTVVFRIKHAGVSYFYGTINQPTGTFRFDEDNPDQSMLEVTAKAKSVETANDKRDEHLYSGDFFKVEQFPEITFKSTSMEKTGNSTWSVTGDLTLLNQTNAITIEMEKIGEADLPRMGHRTGYHTVFTIKRSDYGMSTYVDNGMLGDKVKLTVSLEGVAK